MPAVAAPSHLAQSLPDKTSDVAPYEAIDRYNSEIIAELIQRMKAAPQSIEQHLSLFSAVRHLERIADHATNIAEDVVYLVEGEIVRHRPEALGGE